MQKAMVLREAARRIESGTVRYWWVDSTNCNCGVVAQVAMKVHPYTLACFQEIEGLHGRWALSVSGICRITKLPFSRILRALRASGFSRRDVIHLEGLTEPDIRRAAGLPAARFNGAGTATDCASAPAVVAYMRGWASLLSPEEDAPAVAEPAARRESRELELVEA